MHVVLTDAEESLSCSIKQNVSKVTPNKFCLLSASLSALKFHYFLIFLTYCAGSVKSMAEVYIFWWVPFILEVASP